MKRHEWLVLYFLALLALMLLLLFLFAEPGAAAYEEGQPPATVTALASATWPATPNWDEYKSTAVVGQATQTSQARDINARDTETTKLRIRYEALQTACAPVTVTASATAVPSATVTPLEPTSTVAASEEPPSATPSATGDGAPPRTVVPPSPIGYPQATPTPAPAPLLLPVILTWRTF